MIIQVNSDNHVDVNVNIVSTVEDKVERALARHASRITRVEVHLNDVNAHKNGQDDQRCLIEVRINGWSPIAVSHHAPTLTQALDGALDRIRKVVGERAEKLERA